MTWCSFGLLVVLLTGACTNKEESKVNGIEFKANDSKFEILETNDLFINYLEQVDTTEDAKELYDKEIIQPIYDSCFKDGEHVHMVEDFLKHPPDDLMLLKSNVDAYDSTRMFKNIKQSLTKSSEYLQGDKKTTVCILPTINKEDPDGFNVGSGKNLIYTHLFDSDQGIQTIIAHEYHHSVWTEKFSSSFSGTVLDNLVFEGKATLFEEIVMGTVSVDWSYNKALWGTIEGDLFKKDLDRTLDILNGNDEIPYRYGYSEGYKIVKSYLEEYPETSIKEWTKLDAKTIFEKGKYVEKFYQ